MSKNKYLIRENTDKAKERLENIQNAYVQPLQTVCSAIIKLGLTPDKDLLRDAITNNCESIVKAYNEARGTNDNGNYVLNRILQNEENILFSGVYEAIKPFYNSSNQIYDGRSINNPDLLDLIEIDGSGIKITDETINEVYESVKEYTSTQIGKDLFDLQNKIVKELQIFYDKLNEIDETDGLTLSIDALWVRRNFPNGLYETRQIDGETVYKPRNLNFDPETEEDYNFDIDID